MVGILSKPKMNNKFEQQINYLLEEIDKFFNGSENTGKINETQSYQTDRLVNIAILIEELKERGKAEQLNTEVRNILSSISSLKVNRRILDSSLIDDPSGFFILIEIIIIIKKSFHTRRINSYLIQVDSKLRKIRQMIILSTPS